MYIYIFQRAKKLAIHHAAPSAFLPEETSDKLPPYADAIERATRSIVSPEKRFASSSSSLSLVPLVNFSNEEEKEEAIERAAAAVENPAEARRGGGAAICSANGIGGIPREEKERERGERNGPRDP